MMGSKKIFVVGALVVGAMLTLGSMAFARPLAAAAQGACRGERGGRGFLGHIAQTLNLTPEQQQKGQSILKAAKDEAQQVFTPEQRAQLKQRFQSRGTAPKLNLTADQQAKMKALREETRTKVQAVRNNAALSQADKQTQIRAIITASREQMQQLLTPEQRQQLEARKPHGFFNGLNLTTDQQVKLKAIREKAENDFRAILTAEQQTKFDQIRERMHQRFEQHQQAAPQPAPQQPTK